MQYSQHIKEATFLLGSNRKKLPWLMSLFLLSSFMDVVGIGLIAPYIALIVNSETFIQSDLYSIFVLIGLPYQVSELITVLGFLLVLVFFIKTLSSIYINKAILKFSYQLGAQIRSQLMQVYQNIPYLEYVQRNSSEYIYNIQQMAPQYSQVYIQSFLRLVSEAIIVLAILILLAWNNIYALGLLIFLLGGMIIIYDYFFKFKVTEYGKLSNQHSTRMVQAINEGIEGLKELRILGKESFFYHRVKEEAEKHADINVKSSVISTIPRFLLEFILILFVVLLVFSSTFLGKNLEALLPVLSMFGVAAVRLAPSTSQIISSMTRIRHSFHTVSTLYNDLARSKSVKHIESPETQTSKIKDLSTFQLLQLNNIKFIYSGTVKPAINNLSIDLHAGESIGLIGTSGSGKTTIVDILLGLLAPTGGSVIYNGDPLQNNLPSWRSQVAYIPQNIFLLDDTLRANIAIGLKEDIDEKKVEKAIKQAQLNDLLQQLPKGLDTVLGERGLRLSGGQRQRVALARAFYFDRDVLIMDEATSALDNETEKEIIEEIRRLKGKKTMIVIAHRLTTVKHCDCIYRLENGKVVDKGTYSEVVNNDRYN